MQNSSIHDIRGSGLPLVCLTLSNWGEVKAILISFSRFAEQDIMLQLLFTNLSNPSISLRCADALIVISQRHGGVEALAPVLPLFDDDSLTALELAAR